MTIDRLINEALDELAQIHAAGSNQGFVHNKDETVVTRVLPGVKREEITVSSDGTTLVIKTKSNSAPAWAAAYANNTWRYNLGPSANLAAADAKHVDGILTIRVPKLKQEKNQHFISVN